MPRRPLRSQGQPSLYCPRRHERLGCAGAAVYRIINRHARINNFAFDVHGMVMEDPEEPRSESGPLFKPAGVREIPIGQHW